jgi:hypothetical protein
MFKLTDSLGQIVFQSNHELSNEDIDVLDNENYKFTICNNKNCGDVTVELFLNDIFCKSVEIADDKTGYINFKTGIASVITVRIYPKYTIPTL